MRKLLIFLIIGYAQLLYAAPSNNEITSVLEQYFSEMKNHDCLAAAKLIHSGDLASMHKNLVPVFEQYQKSGKQDLINLSAQFFNGKSTKEMQPNTAFCGMQNIIEASAPDVFKALSSGKISIGSVIVQENEASVQYSFNYNGSSVTDSERLSKEGSHWKIRTKENPEETAHKLLLLLQR